MNHKGTIELMTKHLTLRRFETEDAEHMFYNWANDDAVTKYLTWPPHENIQVTEKVLQDWISRYEEENFYQWAIELNELEQPIGSISVVALEESIDAAELGYCIGQKFWNKGYMTEAITEVIRFLMNEVGASRVWAWHHVKNIYSGKAMAAAGMEYEGTLKKAGRCNQGICDRVVYAKVKSDALLEEEAIEQETAAAAVATKVKDESGRERNVISDETMEYVGILAKLELTQEEAEKAKKDMEEMLDYIDQLNELDTTGVEPLSHVFPVNNVFREDEVTNGDGSKETLINAPEAKDGGFKVPKTIGE